MGRTEASAARRDLSEPHKSKCIPYFLVAKLRPKIVAARAESSRATIKP